MIKLLFQNIASSLLFFLLFVSCSPKQSEIVELTNDGTWCWFSDPRAIYNDENNTLITGYVSENGDVIALQYNLETSEKSSTILYENLEIDDHNNPAFLQRADGRYLAFYTKHHNTGLYMNMSLDPDDASEYGNAMLINPNGKADLEKYGDDRYTYANPMMLKNENKRIYLFGRWIGFKPNMSWSDDGGNSWSDSRVVVCPEPFSWGQRPYVKYFSDGLDKIHMVFTDGHPRDEATNSVYYACYYDGAFHRANGEVICTLDELPFEPKEATLVYNAKITGERAWVYDVYADDAENPSIAYARYPSEQEHIYHYAWYNGSEWTDREVTNSGKWFPQTPEGENEREPHYSGGLSIDPNHQNSLFISKQVDGIFEIEKWQLLKDKWKTTAITSQSANDQVRPYAVKNDRNETLLLWLSVNRYIHYTNFRTSVEFVHLRN
ncbi:MAG: BNR-4 repeat-containing protein [Prolixibacteraceae bacterium]